MPTSDGRLARSNSASPSAVCQKTGRVNALTLYTATALASPIASRLAVALQLSADSSPRRRRPGDLTAGAQHCFFSHRALACSSRQAPLAASPQEREDRVVRLRGTAMVTICATLLACRDRGAPTSATPKRPAPNCVGPCGPSKCPEGMVAIRGGVFVPQNPSSPGSPAAVSDLCIDRVEVTVHEYDVCIVKWGCPEIRPLPFDWPYKIPPRLCNSHTPPKSSNPVNCITWHAATAYCGAVGKRLPSAAEWEWVARGGSRATSQPFGDSAPRGFVCWNRAETCSVGLSLGDRNPEGVMDLAGNVSEWVSTSMDSQTELRLQMGFAFTDTASARSSFVGQWKDPNKGLMTRAGFRCVADVSQ
jgi:formylglycine-generating enzyme required for sulfatase activity